MVEADRNVVGVVGVLAVETVRSEIRLLRLRPPRLSGVNVAQIEMQMCGTGRASQQRLQTALASDRIPLVDGDESGLRDGVGGMEREDPHIVLGRLLPPSGPRRERREPSRASRLPGSEPSAIR